MIPSSAVEETDKNILRKESPVDEANVFSSRSFTKSSKTMKKEKMLSLWIAARAVWSLQEGIYSVASRKETRLEMRMASFAFLGGNPKIPQSTAERDRQAIGAVKAAIVSPRAPSCGLIECEFPTLSALNKMGDGSLRSANEVDQANIEFVSKLFRAISPPLPFLGPRTWLIISSAASSSFCEKAAKATGGADSTIYLKEGIPSIGGRDVCVLVSPSISKDYEIAKRLVSNGNKVVIVNGLAKDQKSIPENATMAFFLKPLTYNSQVAGYLVRIYPGAWTALDAATGATLGTFSDTEILVPGTNTPDLRAAVRQVQTCVDERAIKARQSS